MKIRQFPFAILAAIALLAAFGGSVLARPANPATRELELKVSDHPKKAIAEAEGWLADAAKTRNRPLELKAYRLLALAYEQVEDDAQLGDVARKGLLLARSLGDRESEVLMVASQGSARSLEGKYAEAVRAYDEAAQLAQDYGLDEDLARVNIGRAQVYLSLGRITEALDAAMKAYATFESRGDFYMMSNALSGLANIHSRDNASVPDLDRAVEYHQRSLDLSQPVAGRFDLSTDYFNLGTVHLRLRHYERARSYFDKALALAIELQDGVGAAYVHHRIGVLEKELGRPREALARQDRALVVFKDTGDRVMEFRTQLSRSEVLSILDRRREALEALARARAIVERLKSPRLEFMYHENAAELYARFGDYEKAFAEIKTLRDAERRREDAARSERAAELQARFELKQKEAENALLRARELESEARRLALVLALILSLLVLGFLAFLLVGYIRRHRRVANLALKDDLTGIPNRRSILEYVRLHLRRRMGGGETLTLALIDLDHFKAINDDLGHAVGDQVLVAFAQTCTLQLRSQDRLGRFGGEEFLLVIPGADLAQVAYVFERVRKAVQEMRVAGFPPERRITFSMGAAEARSVADDFESVLQRADRALYKAKQLGRDRFENG